ncbi:pyruvate:ferredoxin (flavodoxin) oxidoreductase [uncultured Oscillibacter sp.]|uniref:pyruvate:ferredoxin (flavodoxin) oxidoreductase n=1 Tax=uncultured Oscillibacter sp. TaxID=876091 RepID=UPI0025EEB14F|nr:pyruvate:ferredoxin (flavodoxin) oxidoreductase [uncultured Oscillibacter sp.]
MSKKSVVMDGNTAAAYVSYAFTEVASIFPITPSSPMAEKVDAWAANGRKNLFGRPVKVIQMQSEAGAAGTCHGALQAGALTTTYTASQGLLLMIPPMYKIAGEFLPAVFHVSSRTVSAHGLSIFGDHSDVMGCRMIGFAMLASSSPQEAMDLGAVAHLAAIRARHPFLHFFDGFRTSHEMQKIDALDYDDLSGLVDQEQLRAFRKNGMNPEHPSTRGTTVNPDIFFQCREGCNQHYAALPGIVEHYMGEINRLTGRDYQPFNYYGAPDAEAVVVLMGSAAETAKETVAYLCAQGKKVGVVQVHLYRPFSPEHLLRVLPASVRAIGVLDRTKEPGGLGEPLYQDVESVMHRNRPGVRVVGGRYGLASKDTTPGQIAAVFRNLEQETPKDNFTIGIVDDVTFTSLPTEDLVIPKEGETACKIWGIGGDGTVGANKNTITTIGLAAGMYAQAYFSYDSKKSGGLTQSHLRFGKDPIQATYLVEHADFVGLHKPSYLGQYDVTADLKEGGTFLLNCSWSKEELPAHIPAGMKRDLARKNAQFYIIDATKIAREIGLGNRTNTVLQAAFFKLTNIIPLDLAVQEMKDGIRKSYLKKAGEKVVALNDQAVERGITGVEKFDIPADWANAADDAPAERNVPGFVRDIVDVMNRQEGDKLPVSAFQTYHCLDGTWQNGTAAYEKRGVAVSVPQWDAEKCIQCNRCALVCPHAAIRPVLLSAEEAARKPAGFTTVPAAGLPQYQYRMQVSPYDCMGCGVCVNACLAKENALEMMPLDTQLSQRENWTFGVEQIPVKADAFSDRNVKGSQFAKPYFEFSAACAGCAETPYVKLVTQLFGDRMYIANASGCSSAYGGSLPTTPYCTDGRGFGPSWQQSLFEDNAEFGYGFLGAHDAVNSEIVLRVQALAEAGVETAACEAYLAHRDDAAQTRQVSDALLAAMERVQSGGGEAADAARFILERSEYVCKKSVWCFGGDGWAYDIGFGGLDHVLAQNQDINMLVMDTEVYSNTGGQSSKATPAAAIAKFAAGGKEVKKKDLGAMLMNYGYIYVAQVAMGADPAQTLRAIREAEAYPGPSIVICYCPCLEHGLKGGMANSQLEQKKAVECGYWHLYRFDPRRKAEGKNPFQLDSREPTGDLRAYLKSERRYASLQDAFPDRAERLYEKEIQDAADRLEAYQRLGGEG